MIWQWFKDLFTTLGVPLNENLEIFGLTIPSVDIFAFACFILIVLVFTFSFSLLWRKLWFR